MYDIVALGEMLIDFTCVGQDDDGYPLMQGHPGGAPVNFLAAAAKYGAKTAQFAKVGADAFGKLLIRSFADAGIGTEGIRISDEFFTTLAFVTLDEHGDREFSFARKPGADTQLRADELDAEMLENEQLRQIVRFACAAAGMSVEKPGGMSSVPEKTDVLECLKRWEI